MAITNKELLRSTAEVSLNERYRIFDRMPNAHESILPPQPYYARPLLGLVELQQRNDNEPLKTLVEELVDAGLAPEGYRPGIVQSNLFDTKTKEDLMAQNVDMLTVPRHTKHMLKDSMRNSSHNHDTENVNGFSYMCAQVVGHDKWFCETSERLAVDPYASLALFRARFGLASPSECMYVFENLFKNTSVGWTELARHTYGLEPDEAIASSMDSDVKKAIRESGGNVFERPQFHGVKVKQSDSHPTIDETDEGYKRITFNIGIFDKKTGKPGQIAVKPFGIVVSYKNDIGTTGGGSVVRRRDKFYIPLDDELRSLVYEATAQIDPMSINPSGDDNLGVIISKDPALSSKLREICENGPSESAKILNTVYYAFKKHDSEAAIQLDSISIDPAELLALVDVNYENERSEICSEIENLESIGEIDNEIRAGIDRLYERYISIESARNEAEAYLSTKGGAFDMNELNDDHANSKISHLAFDLITVVYMRIIRR